MKFNKVSVVLMNGKVHKYENATVRYVAGDNFRVGFTNIIDETGFVTSYKNGEVQRLICE